MGCRDMGCSKLMYNYDVLVIHDGVVHNGSSMANKFLQFH